MNLMEVMTAALLFLASSGASLALWSQAAGSLADDSDRLARSDRLEAVLVAVESRLRDPDLRQGAPALPCPVLLDRLAATIEAGSLPVGMERHLTIAAPGDLLQLRLVEGGEERMRSYNPAAFGGCGEVAPPATEPGHAS